MPFYRNQRSNDYIKTDYSNEQAVQPTQKPVQQKTAYQQNVSQPVEQNPQKWYKGATPTTGEIYGRIQTIGKTDPSSAQQIAIGFAQAQMDRNSPWYNPYTQATNQAVKNLQSYGVDTNMLTDEWFANNTGWQSRLRFSATTNGVLQPLKKSATDEDWIAYNLYQYQKSMGDTQKADTEWAALQQELTYKAGRKDRNYTDDSIINSINWSKYPTLRKMQESKGTPSPIELNHAIDFSDDGMRAVLWAARNNGGTGNIYSDMAASAMGEGNVWKDNPELSAKLNWNNKDTYAPYSVGMTLDEEVGLYFNVDHFDQETLDQIRKTLDPNDETAMKMYNRASKAFSDTQKALKEKSWLDEKVNKSIKDGKSQEWILGKLDTWMKECPTLKAMDESIINGSNLVETTQAIDHKRADLEDSIRTRAAEKGTQHSAADVSEGTVKPGDVSAGTVYSWEDTENIEASPELKNLSSEVRDADEAKKEQRLRNQREADARAASKKDTTQDNITLQTKHSKDQEVRDVSSVMDDGASEMESAIFNSWSGSTEEAQAKLKEFKAGQINGEVVSDLDKIYQKQTDSVNKGYIEGSMNVWNSITGYQDQQKALTNAQNTLSELEKELGLKLYVGRTNDLSFEAEIDGNKYRVRMSPDLGDIEAIDNINNPDVPTPVYASYGLYDSPDEWDADTRVWDAVENGKDISSFRDRYQEEAGKIEEASKIQLTDEDNAKLKAYRRAQMQIEDAEKYLEKNKEQYEKDLKEYQNLEQRRAVHIKNLKDAGVDTTSIEIADAVMNELTRYTSYEATQWDIYNPTYAYYKAIADGKDKNKVLADAEKEYAEIAEQIKDLEWLQKYVSDHGIKLSADVKKNMDRRMEKMQRDMKDYEFFKVQWSKDFDKVAADAEAKEQTEIAAWQAEHPNSTEVYANVGTIYGDFQDWYAELTDDEKKTWYYLKAQDEKNGTNKAKEYADFLTDETYGVMPVRGRENMEEFAEQFTSAGAAGFIGANALAVYLSPYNAIASTAYRIKNVITGEELNPNSGYLSAQQFRSKTREQSAQEILEAFGEKDENGNYKETTLSKVAQAGYEILTNRLDSLANATAFGWMFGGIGNDMIKEFLSASPMGMSAAMETAAKAKDNGASDAQAYALATWTFFAETMTEAISLENIAEAREIGKAVKDGTYKQFLTNWLTKAGISEAFGESINDIVENLSDEKIMGVLSEHQALVDKYREDGLDPDQAELRAREDEINGVLRTALISYLSPGLDVFQVASGHLKYYRGETARRVAAGEEGLTVRQVRKEDIAKRREQRAKEKAQQEAWDQEYEQRDEGEMKPIDYDAAGDTYGLSTEDMKKEQLRLKKERADQFTLDFEILETAEGGDASAQNAAVSAVLDEGSTRAETDEANAAATGLGDVVAEGKTTAAEVQDLMIGANVANGEIPFTTVKTGLKYAALGGEQSACRQLMQSQEYQNAAPALKAAMMAKAVQQDQQNDAVREAVQKNTHEYRVARAEGEIMAQNSEAITTKIESAEAASIEAEGVTLDAQRTLDSQKKVEQSAMQAAQRAAVYNDAATHERKLNEYRKQVEIRKSYERGLEAAQRKEAATKKREERIKQQVRNDLRQQAEQMVAQEDQRRAEEAEQQRIEQEQQAAEQAEAERTLNEQEANEEQQDQTSIEQNVRERLQEIGYTGEDLERQVRRVMGRAEQNGRRKENMNTRLSEKDGDKFLRKISRRTGITYEMQDLGDPRKTRGKIIDRQHMILNSNLTKGQALVEAALHEVTHGVEETKAYENYASFVLNAMYKGEDTKEYNDALERKIKEYADDFNSLSPEEARKRARQELVAEYARLNLGKKEFVRGIVSNGLAGKFREVLSNAVAMLKGYTLDAEGKSKYQEMRTAMKLLNEAVNERAQQTKKSNNGHTGLVQMSINGWTDATGLTLEVTGDDSHMYRLKYNGEEIKPGEYKAEMVKGTPVGNLIDMAGRARVETLTNKLERGKLTQQEYNKQINKISKTAKQQREYVAQIINMIGKYQDAAMVWELAGSLAFSSLKTNGDPQYSDSYDFGTICTKTQAILNAISETQVKLGRALTKEEIDGVVYNEVGKGVQDKNGKWIHGATPCPPCYVYATWVNKPARLEKVRLYQQECVDWTNEQINEFMNRPDPEGRTKTEAKELKTEQNAQKLWISLCLADEVTDPETGKKTWVRKENPDICPNEILLDLRRSGDMAVQHPGTWTFMQKGGNAQGKAIAPYSDARLGESIVAKAIGAGEANAQMLEDERNAGNSEYIPQFLNPFLSADPNDQKQAEDYFKKAIQKIKAQNLKGGQRWQSWSDFRAEWGSDYLMEMITMEALGSQVQTYTKVVEALDLLASAGFEVNMSLMPHGDGFWHNEDGSIKVDEDGNLMLRFSNVTGINPEAAEAFAKKYGEKGNVQPMVVGISDEHIKAALAGNYITFVIPFHGSGGSVQRLQHLMSLLHEQMDSGNDYTKAQSDDFENYITVGEGKTKKKINTNPNWAIREKILTGEYENATDEEIDALDDLPFLKKLYEDRYINEDSDAFGVFFSKGEAQQIYPYEYWDTETTLATADKNSQRFIDYCQMLGVIPRFSGLTKTVGKGKKAHEVEYANFSGRKVVDGKVTYEPVKGYWKLLIDRSMYNRVYDENGKIIPEKCTYHKPQAVSTANIEIGAMPMAANNTVGHSDDDTREITERIIQQIEMTSGQNEAAGSAVDLQQNADTLNNVINEGSGIQEPTIAEQKSTLGDLSESEMDQLLDGILKRRDQYSAPLEGENPALSSPTGPAQRQFGQGMLQDSDEIDQQAKDYVLAHNGRGIDTNEEQLNRAIKWIRSLKQSANSDGFYEAMEQIDSDDFDYRSADGQARMIAVMGLAVAKGDAKSQARLADAFNRQGTDLGRALQARKLFRLMTPDGRKETLRNMLKKYQSELDAKGKRIDLKFSEWVFQAAAEATSEGDFEKVRQAALIELAEQIPANWKDRIRSLRMLAMLANPRTHIRNIVGNMLFVPAVSIKNKLGAVAEIATGQKERTKTLALASSKEIRDFARQDANNIKGLLTGEVKYSEATQIARAQNKLGRALDWASEKNSNALEAEDWFFLKGHYRRALGGWMTANGYTVEQVQNDPALLEKGREYAINEAQKATYRDFNKTAAVLNEVSRKGGIAGFLVDAALPFKKTPANILRRGIEYSPVGIVKTLTADMYHLKQYQDYQNGKLNALPEKAMSPNQVIDHLCAGLSGTAVLALGFLLAGTGAVSCGLDDDEDKFGKEKGEQEYAVKLSLFGEDVTYTMDWAAPMSMPFFVGAAIRNQMDSEGSTDIEGVLNELGAMTEPVFNLSMLDGINTLFKTSSYDNTNPITQIGAKIAANYVSSYVPSVLGAISRTFFDDKQRKAFVEQGKGTGVMGTFRYTLEQMQNKIPGLAQQNIAARDIWGNEKTTGFMERLFENFISPGYIEHVEEDPLINEMARVYEATGSNDAGLVPSDPDKTISFTLGGVTHKKILTDKEWDRFKEVRGQTAFNELTELFNNPDYQNATLSAQAQMIKNIWNHADKIGRAAVWSEYDPGEPKSVSNIAKEGKINTYKTEIVKALRAEDYEAYDTMVEAMREEYDDDSDADSAIKEKIGNTFRDEWKKAYRNNDYATMYEIEEWLDYTGYDFNIYGKNGWQEKVDEQSGT